MSSPIFPEVNSTTGALPAFTEARYLSAAAGALKAPLASPALTGTPTAPTPTAGDDSTKIATTAFVHDELAGFAGASDASTVAKGVVQLAGDLGGTAAAPTVPVAVKLTGAQTIAGVKTFSSPPVVPDPVSGDDAANKDYVDALSAAGVADATSSVKGKVQLAADLGGTAAAPTTPTAVHVTGAETIAGAKTFITAPTVPDDAFAQTKIIGLVAALATHGTLSSGLQPVAELPAGVILRVRKSGSTWPARPTTRVDVCVDWEGADPSPPIVTSGTAGMYAGDRRSIPAT